ncbi:hypothetical protein IAQ61_002254 [Plenodomus lingam]|uniref:RlpA-like protein double-psi beta-barrel domain-containing protein n=1 Tax=Leptosphaeria maculans (strain JN3 / isolate v23.1.3 / race Av1-4-5-6-7-8) TaxID=985895 RepID=E4ZIA8_LEPMJ|nr:hypothetical protein LEMA_P058030.1 [Plenodomus lingam JN3]KAH9876893.1 hypothetical protein IAQ61_002254 [Plenodomus lingam]CBX90769.1 hypothetical protein LEMA_P058030.1 [Plenodomus lingam JN3]
MTTHMIPRKEVGQPCPAHLKEIHATHTTSESGWDIPEKGLQKRDTGLGAITGASPWALADRFDHIFPPYKRYFGRSRRTVLIVIGVFFLCLLALIIGLAVGLRGRSKTQNLPLPGGAQTYTGDLTYYDPGLGACGIDSGDDDPVVAISHYTFDAAQTGSDPNQNPLCGRKIRARRVNESTGKSVSIDVTVIDRCTGCQPTDIDVSPAMFDKMADHALGRVTVTWAWL